MADAHATPHHDYHLVNPSPWPLIASFATTIMFIGAVVWMKGLVGPDAGPIATALLAKGDTVLFFAGTPIGAPLIGWLSDQFGPRVGLVGGGLISLLGALALTAMLLRRRLAQSTDRQGHTRDAGGEQQTAEDAGADADGQQQEVDPDQRTRYRDDDARDPRPTPR